MCDGRTDRTAPVTNPLDRGGSLCSNECMRIRLFKHPQFTGRFGDHGARVWDNQLPATAYYDADAASSATFQTEIGRRAFEEYFIQVVIGDALFTDDFFSVNRDADAWRPEVTPRMAP